MVTTSEKLLYRPARKGDRQRLADLVHFETHVHRHLDWRSPLDWVGYQPYIVAERNGKLEAALACPPDPPNMAWIRLFAVSSDLPLEQAWDELWNRAKSYLSRQRRIIVAVIPLQNWFRKLLERSGFEHAHDVVMLKWEPGVLPQSAKPSQEVEEVRIRLMNYDDLPKVRDVDAAAFDPVWHNTLDLLKIAFEQAAVATVAVDREGIVGYQISTNSPMGGHLARLAVHPRAQGRGIGYKLVRDMLIHFELRGAQQVTVNTQTKNRPSLALYEKAGFRNTGEVFPVYQIAPI
jgi:ribosomal protein S18 acetylase RimI-like enzyme